MMKFIFVIIISSFYMLASDVLEDQQNKFYDWKTNEMNIKFRESEQTHRENLDHQLSQQEDILHDNIQQNIMDASQVIFNAN